MYRSAALQAKPCDGDSLWPCHGKDDGVGCQVPSGGSADSQDPQVNSVGIQGFAKLSTALWFGQQELKQRRFLKTARHVQLGSSQEGLFYKFSSCAILSFIFTLQELSAHFGENACQEQLFLLIQNIRDLEKPKKFPFSSAENVALLQR